MGESQERGALCLSKAPSPQGQLRRARLLCPVLRGLQQHLERQVLLPALYRRGRAQARPRLLRDSARPPDSDGHALRPPRGGSLSQDVVLSRALGAASLPLPTLAAGVLCYGQVLTGMERKKCELQPMVLK